MNLPRFQDSPSDHHIQAAILQQLFASNLPVAFSSLRPDGVENSLFMYHVRKLESRGAIKRDTDGFSLTDSGARWVNLLSPYNLKPKLVPRLLPSLIIISTDNKSVLLSRRKSAVASLLTRYILPSGFHKYGVPLHQAAADIAEYLLGQSTKLEYYDTCEIIYRFTDGYVHHVYMPTFGGIADIPILPTQEHYELVWVPISELITNFEDVYDDPIPEILRRFTNDIPLAHETFEVQMK